MTAAIPPTFQTFKGPRKIYPKTTGSANPHFFIEALFFPKRNGIYGGRQDSLDYARDMGYKKGDENSRNGWGQNKITCA